jgi:hypothetical protein
LYFESTIFNINKILQTINHEIKNI